MSKKGPSSKIRINQTNNPFIIKIKLELSSMTHLYVHAFVWEAAHPQRFVTNGHKLAGAVLPAAAFQAGHLRTSQVFPGMPVQGPTPSSESQRKPSLYHDVWSVIVFLAAAFLPLRLLRFGSPVNTVMPMLIRSHGVYSNYMLITGKGLY